MVSARRNVINTLWFISFIGMAITGFFPLILGNTTLNRWWMILHVSIAPLFSILLAIGALYCAKKMGIDFKDSPESKLSRILFWFFLFLFIPNALSILFSMNTWFVSSTQYVFLKVHFYSAIVMLLLVVLHFNLSSKNKG